MRETRPKTLRNGSDRFGERERGSRRGMRTAVAEAFEREVLKEAHRREVLDRGPRNEPGAVAAPPEGEGQSVAWEPNRVAARAGGVEVYRVENIELRPGDRIRWTRNDTGLGLVNSQTAEVAAVRDGKVTFRLEDRRMLDLSQGDPQLRHVDRA